MAVYVCTVCAAEKESRCKPQKCECGAKGTWVKKEEPAKK
ncbi:MAG: RCKP-type rubredoxin-like domain-containing protein [Mycobacterium leprae]